MCARRRRTVDDRRLPLRRVVADLCGVGTGPSDEQLAALTVAESRTVPDWMTSTARAFSPLSQAPFTSAGRTGSSSVAGRPAQHVLPPVEPRIPVVYETNVRPLTWCSDGGCRSLVVDAAAPVRSRRERRRLRQRGLRGQHPVVDRVLGRRGRELPHPRTAIQRRTRAASCLDMGAARRARSADSTPSPWTRAARSSTAASLPASTRFRSASW